MFLGRANAIFIFGFLLIQFNLVWVIWSLCNHWAEIWHGAIFLFIVGRTQMRIANNNAFKFSGQLNENNGVWWIKFNLWKCFTVIHWFPNSYDGYKWVVSRCKIITDLIRTLIWKLTWNWFESGTETWYHDNARFGQIWTQCQVWVTHWPDLQPVPAVIHIQCYTSIFKLWIGMFIRLFWSWECEQDCLCFIKRTDVLW